jgi:hypothetical protein
MNVLRCACVTGFLLSGVQLRAQSSRLSADTTAPRYFITTIPVRVILSDFNIGAGKRITPDQTLELRLGYVHRNNLLHPYYEGWLTSAEMRFHGPSVYVQWNKWKRTKKKRQWYWGLIAGYRYLWYHDEALWLGGTGGSSFDEQLTLSQWRNDVLLLGTIGIRTTRITSTEISLGVRLSHTYTHVGDTRFHPSNMTQAEYDQYRGGQVSNVPYASGFSILPVLRLSTRIGKFQD